MMLAMAIGAKDITFCDFRNDTVVAKASKFPNVPQLIGLPVSVVKVQARWMLLTTVKATPGAGIKK